MVFLVCHWVAVLADRVDYIYKRRYRSFSTNVDYGNAPVRLSDFEVDVMNLIWRCGECTAPQVHREIEKNKSVTYSTVKTIVDRLEKKGAIQRTKTEGRTIYFKPAIAASEIQLSLVDKLLGTIFAGDRRPLFSRLLSSEELTKADLAFLSDLIDKRRGELGDD